MGRSAFTLVEIMIVMAVMVTVMAMALPRLGGRNHQIRSSMHRVALLSEQVRQLAKLERSTYRLVIQIDNENAAEPVNRYWAEKAEGRELLPSPDELQDQDDVDEAVGDEVGGDEAVGNEAGATPEFQPSRIGGEPSDLPSGLIFDSVEVHGFDAEFRSGRVYIYYSAQGLVQEAAIHFKAGEESVWTLAIDPLTGRGERASGRISLEEIQDR